MKAIKVEPQKKAELIEIKSNLENLQEVVGGGIEITYPFEDMVAIVCNENGKIDGFEFNRALYDDDGNMYDIIAGTFLVVGLSEDDFCDLSQEYIDKYLEMYKEPKMFIRTTKGVVEFPLVDRIQFMKNKRNRG